MTAPLGVGCRAATPSAGVVLLVGEPKLRQEIAALQADKAALTDTVAGLHATVAELQKLVSTLEKNISVLYDTAKLEIQRKDSRINELRAQIDNGVKSTSAAAWGSNGRGARPTPGPRGAVVVDVGTASTAAGTVGIVTGSVVASAASGGIVTNKWSDGRLGGSSGSSGGVDGRGPGGGGGGSNQGGDAGNRQDHQRRGESDFRASKPNPTTRSHDGERSSRRSRSRSRSRSSSRSRSTSGRRPPVPGLQHGFGIGHSKGNDGRRSDDHDREHRSSSSVDRRDHIGHRNDRSSESGDRSRRRDFPLGRRDSSSGRPTR
jgi:hypothetical protein